MDRKNLLLIILVFLFGILSAKGFFHQGLPPTHDGEYHVVRFYEFNKMFENGVVYPRWAPDLNYGYGVPLFNYVYPLPNLAASLIHYFKFNFIDSFKISMILATLIGGIFFFLWARQFWGSVGGFVSSVFYLFSPYKFVDMYIRGSIGEIWVIALLPCFLWSFTKVIKDNFRIYIPLSGLFLALIIFSHNILGLMSFGFIVIYSSFLIIFSKEKKKNFISLLIVLIISLGLSAIFWIPALFEKKFVTGLEVYDVVANFPELYQLIIPSWGSGFSSSSINNQMSFQIGIANLIAIISTLIVIVKNRKIDKILYLFLSLFFIVAFLMLKQSIFIWKSVPLMNYFQFPWRLLSLEILLASFLAGFIFRNKIIAIIMIIFCVILGIGYTKIPYYHNRGDNYYMSRSNFIDSTNSPGNSFNTIWFKSKSKRVNSKIQKNPDFEIYYEKINPVSYKYGVNVKKNSIIYVNAAYFPGWTSFVDSKKVEIKQEKEGIFSFPIEKGRHSLEIVLMETRVQAIGKIVSIISLILIISLFLFYSFDKIRK